MMNWLLEESRSELRNQVNWGGGREGVATQVREKLPPSVWFTSNGVMLGVARTRIDKLALV